MLKIFITTIASIFFSLNFIHSQTIDSRSINSISKKIGVPPAQIKKALSDKKNMNSSFLPTEELGTDSLDIVNKENIIDEINQNFQDDRDNTVNNNSQDNIDNGISDNIKNEDINVKKEIKTPDVTKIYFGYNIFNQDPKLFEKSTDISIDPNYLIGPGDEIVIMLWGETEINESYIVTREGYLFIDNIGQVFVNGLTIDLLENKLFKLFLKSYSSLGTKSGSDKTYFDVSLGKTVHRPIRIFALGELDQPGAYSVKSNSTLFTSLYYFNGPNTNGSLRNIKLIRNGEEIATIDLYDFLLSGKRPNDIRLQRDDIIFIPNRGKTIVVYGEINRPHIYELIEGETLIDLIEVAGGLTAETYTERAQISRIIDFKKRKDKNISRTLVDVNLNHILSKKNSQNLYENDKVTFYKILGGIDNLVTIEGSVFRPGSYELSKNMSLLDLINSADGLTENAYLEKADITRLDSFKKETFLSINLKDLFDNQYENNVPLFSGDVVTIYDLSDLKLYDDVFITGHVLNPGKKKFKDGMTVFDLIFLGGGFLNENHLKNTYMERAELSRWNFNKMERELITFRLDSLLSSQISFDKRLFMGDSVRVYSKEEITGNIPNEVSISGFVKRQGNYPVSEEMKVLDLLFAAGGIDDPAHFSKIFLARADLYRFNEDKITKKIIRFNLEKLINGKSDFDDTLFPGDEIKIFSTDMFKTLNTISIYGNVRSPGEYELQSNMTLYDAIAQAGGIDSDHKFINAEVSRNKENSKTEDKKNIVIINKKFKNSPSTFELDNKNDLFLSANDYIIIRDDPFPTEKNLVNISGYVFYPGDYVLDSPNTKVSEIIKRAGGLSLDAFPKASTLLRNENLINLSFSKIIKNPNSKHNFELLPGDSISIGSKTNIVTVQGAVHSPGNYRFYSGYRVNDYIKMAGGLTEIGAIKSSYVKYIDGKSKGVGIFSNPRVEDSSEIFIGSKAETEAFNLTEYVSSLSAIYADISQVLLLISLTRN